MSFFRKYRFEVLLILSSSLLYFCLRLFNILELPIFTDEAIYVRWAQIANNDAGWRFISLTDGKQPSFVWIATVFMRIFSDPLLAGRLVSVMAGFFSMVGLFFLTSELFKNRRIGFIASLLYIFYPFALVYDRMALYDSLVGAFTIWSLFLAVLLVRRLRLDLSLILGMVIGGGMLTKTNAFFSIPLLIPTLLLFDFKHKEWKLKLLKCMIFFLVSSLLAFGMYSILRLSPFFHIIGQKNALFSYPISEWIKHPFQFFLGNLRGLFDWFLTYMSLPVLSLIFASFIIDSKTIPSKFLKNLQILSPFIVVCGLILLIIAVGRFHKDLFPQTTPFIGAFLLAVFVAFSYIKRVENFSEKALLIIWFGAPFVYLAFFGNTIYPRFILFMTLFLLPLIAYSVFNIASFLKKNISKGIIFVFFLFWIISDFYILTDFARSPIPHLDLEQYSNGWPAGGGVKEMISFFQEESKDKKIYIASEGTFGSLPTLSIEIYLGENKNIEKRGIWPLSNQIPPDLVERAQIESVYFVFNESQKLPQEWPIELIAKYRKGIGNSYMSLYKILPLRPL